MREERVKVADHCPGLEYLGSGWSRPEEWGVWTDSEEAQLHLNVLSDERSVALRLVGRLFRPNIEVGAMINRDAVPLTILELGDLTEFVVEVPDHGGTDEVAPDAYQTWRYLEVILTFRNVASPRQLGESEDARRLGFGIHSIEMSKATSNRPTAAEPGTGPSDGQEQSAEPMPSTRTRDEDLISIVLPVYNHASLLPIAVRGILEQSYTNWELIVVNDGSEDDFDAAMEPFLASGDLRIRVIDQSNKGLPAALNTGFRQARGAYLTWTSADNITLPRQLERLLECLRANPNAGLAFSNYMAIDDLGRPLGEPHWRSRNREAGSAQIVLPDEVTIENFHRSNDNFIGPSFLYRAVVAAAVGTYNEDLLGVEDYDYWLRMHVVTKFVHVDDSLYRYRVHENSISSKEKELQLSRRAEALVREDERRRGAILRNRSGLGRVTSGPWRSAAQYKPEALRVSFDRNPSSDTHPGEGSIACVLEANRSDAGSPPHRYEDADVILSTDVDLYWMLKATVIGPRVLLGDRASLSSALPHAVALRTAEYGQAVQVGAPARSQPPSTSASSSSHPSASGTSP